MKLDIVKVVMGTVRIRTQTENRESNIAHIIIILIEMVYPCGPTVVTQYYLSLCD